MFQDQQTLNAQGPLCSVNITVTVKLRMLKRSVKRKYGTSFHLCREICWSK